MKKDFLTYQAQTTPHPLSLEISHASGSYIYDASGKEYLDFIAGVSANSLGHNHPKVKEAIINQLEKYTHVMVYGEFIQKPQVELCKLLAHLSPKKLNSVYLTNSGTEATEGALKLAKRYTKRYEIIACNNSYHGNTQGAMSVCGVEEQNGAFRPLIPGISFIDFNDESQLHKITKNTAAVIIETIQGGAGFIEPNNNYLHKVQKQCEKVGTLLILDEIQTGTGRTGTFFGFENYNCEPDIIVTGKGLGGGMPIGAFIAKDAVMATLKEHPKLGHITTFGGHPVIAASALTTIKEITESNLMNQALEKECYFRELLQHELILEIRGKGLMLALIVNNEKLASDIILTCLKEGLLLFWLLFEGKAIRITPPLTISKKEIEKGCKTLLSVLDKIAAV